MESDRMENRKLLEQELRLMTKEKRQVEKPKIPKRKTAAELFDNWNKSGDDVVLMVKKRLNGRSPVISKEKSNELSDYWKKSEKRRSVESPAICKIKTFSEPADHWKTEKRRSVESPAICKRKTFSEPYDHWKTEKRCSIDSSIASKGNTSRESYDYCKNKPKKKRSVDWPIASKGYTSTESYDYWKKKSEKRHNVESPVVSKRRPSRELYDCWKKFKKRRSVDSPVASDGNASRELYDCWKKSKKRRSVDSPVALDGNSSRESYEYEKYKSEKKRSIESPITSKRSTSRELCDCWKKSEKRRSIESHIASKGNTSRVIHDYWKKFEKRLSNESPIAKGETSHWKKCEKQCIFDLHTISKRKTPDELFSKKYEKLLMVEKNTTSEEKASSVLIDNWNESENRCMVKPCTVTKEKNSDELFDYPEEYKKILMVKKRRTITSPAPSDSSSVEIINNPMEYEKKSAVSKLNENLVSLHNSYYTSPVSSSTNLVDKFKNSVQQNECGSPENSNLNTSVNSSKFCENCRCVMGRNLNAASENLHYNSSSQHDTIECSAKNDLNFWTANSTYEEKGYCSVTERPALPKRPLCGQNIRIICMPNYSTCNYFEKRKVTDRLNHPEYCKFPAKYAYFKNRAMQKTFSPYHYYAPKESVYKWQRPQNTSASMWKRQPVVSKEQLDNELDNYMAEVKFKAPTTEKEDIQPFIEEYMSEVEKSLNQHYTVDTFN